LDDDEIEINLRPPPAALDDEEEEEDGVEEEEEGGEDDGFTAFDSTARRKRNFAAVMEV